MANKAQKEQSAQPRDAILGQLVVDLESCLERIDQLKLTKVGVLVDEACQICRNELSKPT